LAPGSYLLALAGASLVVAVVKRSLCGLMAGPVSGIMHMSWSAGLLRQLLKGQRP
jgi:succinoglycan biosynthesis protein ExoA